MKRRYLPSVFLGLLVLALLALIWPMTRRAGGRYRINRVRRTEELAKDLERMQASAGQNLEKARALARAVEVMQRPVQVPETDPFAKKQQVPQGGGESEGEQESPEPAYQDVHTLRREGEWPQLRLSGIVVTARGAMAVINGEVCGIGSIVEGLRVAEIGEGRAVLVSPKGERRVLVLVGRRQREEKK